MRLMACRALFTSPYVRVWDVALGREARGVIGRFRYIACVKCPYRVAGKASALRAGKRAPG